MDTTMSIGKRYVPNAKAMVTLRTEMNTIVQCLNVVRRRDDEKIWARDYTPVIPDELQSTQRRLISLLIQLRDD